MVKYPPAVQDIQARSLGREDPLEKGMATYPSIIAWRVPGTEKTGRLQSIGVTKIERLILAFLLFCIFREASVTLPNGNPSPQELTLCSSEGLAVLALSVCPVSPNHPHFPPPKLCE